ncbi:alpha/beta hydrolase [Comamonadaceae bacterium OH2545_COT-014]|nr:alpha/beta hydrolase [Comamonadaceae bacterium OH2545_COT-014]
MSRRFPDPRHRLPDAQWLERMYNNRLRVPAHAQHAARWEAASRQARDALPCQLDLAYGEGAGQVLDVFEAPRAAAPVVVFIHGGGWRGGSKAQYGFVAAALRQMGAAVVLPDYARCPSLDVMQITLQMVQALAWTWRHAARFGGSARRIHVMGHGAGGQLAAMMLACAWPVFDPALPPRLVRGAMGLAGLYDLAPLMHTPSIQEALRLTPRQVQCASPARLPAPPSGRLLAVVGGDESGEYQRQTRLIQQAWGRARVPQALALAGLNHFSLLDALAQPGHRLNRLARELLRG